MAKTRGKGIKVNLSTTPEAWEKAREKSLEMFGYENRSGYITYLINSAK